MVSFKTVALALPLAIALWGIAAAVFSTSEGADIDVVTTSPDLERHLLPYKELLGTDYPGYRNHLYRVLSFTLYFLRSSSSLSAAQLQTLSPIIEAALVCVHILTPSCNASSFAHGTLLLLLS